MSGNMSESSVTGDAMDAPSGTSHVKISKRDLAIPLSTVSSESAFSCGGRVLGDTRASLTPQALEALVCAKDWLIKIPTTDGPSSAGAPRSHHDDDHQTV